MINLNSIQITGNLTKDPEQKAIGADKQTILGTFSIANNTRTSNKEEVVFVNVKCWNKVAENVCKYLTKGSPVLIEGRFCQDSYEDKDGNKKTFYYVNASRVQFASSKPKSDDTSDSVPTKTEDPDDLPF